MSQPKPEAKRYRDLISEIEKGIIKIPIFQREFVWSLGETARLLDSILKGYPIGTFILWQTDERLNDIKDIGNLEIPEVPEGHIVQYVLDGQQRITSLYAAYKGAEVHRIGDKKISDYKKIFVDLTKDISDEDDQIIVSVKPDHDNYVSLNLVLNMLDRYNELEKEYTQEQMGVIRNYNDAFRTYDFSTVLLRQNDINTAIEVFTRINTSGQTLTLFEIMSAKTYDKSKQFDMSLKWNEYKESLVDINYDGISNSIILNLISIVLSKTMECKRSTILKLDKDEIIDIWEDAISALNKSINYFRTVLGVPVSHLLPYDILLVPFAYFFFKTELPDGNQRKYLEEFFWRVSLSFRYSSATEARLAQDIKRINQIIEGNRPSYDELKVQLNKPEDLIERIFRAGNSYCKAILCLLSQKDPKNFRDNSRIVLDNSNLSRANSKNYLYIFPKNFLRKNNYGTQYSVMNISLISADQNTNKVKSGTPSRYIKEFADENENIERTLETHYISQEGFGIESDDYPVFLKKRAEWIFKEINERLNLTKPEKPNNEVAEIIAAGESDSVEFKSSVRYDRRQAKVNKNLEYAVAKTVAAFMNTKGGTLIIGVNDNQDVLGIDADIQTLTKNNRDGFELHLIEVLKKYIDSDKLKHVQITYSEIDNEVICMVNVSESSDPVFTIFEGRENFYIRMGSASHPLSREEQNNYLRNR